MHSTTEDDLREIVEEAFNSLFTSKDSIVAIIPVSLGETIMDDSFSGDLDPINIELPILYGIRFALRDQIKQIEKQIDSINANIYRSQNWRDKEADRWFFWRDDDLIHSPEADMQSDRAGNVEPEKIKDALKRNRGRLERDLEVAPLIHGRTLKCDYNIKFAVRPKDFNDSLIYWARGVILPATGDLDFVNNVRQIVASNGKIKIAGIACTMKYFVENLLDGDEQNRARNYSRDNANRNFGVFLGYSFKAGNEIPVVTYSELWKMFERYLVPKWDREIFDTPQVDYEYEVRSKKSSATIAERGKEINGVEIYESSLNTDEKLFENYLARSMSEDVIFCSALEQFQPIADGIYTAVTTSTSIIKRLENRRRKTDLPKKNNLRIRKPLRRPPTNV